MNKDGEVLIYDGSETVYAVPFLFMDETYEKGKNFLGNQTLTEEQKVQYHCEQLSELQMIRSRTLGHIKRVVKLSNFFHIVP